MRRKSAGKKIMVVLVAASLALTPAELTVAAEMEPEGAEATFLAEESGDAASSDQEDTAETEAEIADGSAATEEQETTDTDKPDTGNNVQENAETGVMEPGEEAPEGLQKRKIRRLRKRQWMQPKRWRNANRKKKTQLLMMERRMQCRHLQNTLMENLRGYWTGMEH
ncbi:hypothetical protein [Blautia massiliensis (ex Durand et al. 2017)]|uniref:hypothetical protein n=1 Tax=Blautia massiliensis (ex Durand et al. 2017) TaxID=1737424 RepID=UPI0039912301